MIILIYVLSIVAFYISYMLANIIFGILGLAIRKVIYKSLKINKDVTLSGQLLLFVSSMSTTFSYFSSFLIFIYFDKFPSWLILTPVFIISWFVFAPSLYKPEFESGAAHWGMVFGVITWFVIFFNI